ncbi:uncharacterized protein [Primulina huaijiensis]|uniref:uncharacterized protein isoform X2 n=2 Tax=Primulina huaijiensis TaxID=1492673 RepID=UPI003CC78612
MGILCKHALLVFNCMDVTVLPKCYILNRWMKNVRNRVSSDFEENGSGGHVSEMVFVNQIMKSMYDLSQQSKPHEDARKRLYTIIDTAKEKISNLLQNLSVDDDTPCDAMTNDGHIDETRVRDPLTAKAKGVTNTNITRHWDTKRKKGKGKRKTESSSTKESKLKGQSSQEQQNITPSQYPFTYPQVPMQYPFAYPRVPSQYTFAYPQVPSQFAMEGNTNLYLSGQMNVLPYPYGNSQSSQGHDQDK